MALPTYSSKNVIMSFGGANIVGWEKVSIAPEADIHTPRKSADNKTSISILPDDGARCTLTLFAESPSNYYLSAAANMTKAGFYVPLAFAIVDPSGSVLGLARGVSVVKVPTIDIETEAGSRDWELYIEHWYWAAAPEEVGAVLAEADAAAISSGIATIMQNFTV